MAETTRVTSPLDLSDQARSEVARFLAAYLECSADVQRMVAEMTAIVCDPESTDDERTLAGDAMLLALFPGTTERIIVEQAEVQRTAAARQARRQVAAEEAAFADKLRQSMLARGLTQEMLAAKTNVGQPAISNLLNRRCRPQRRTIAKLAEALGVHPQDLWEAY